MDKNIKEPVKKPWIWVVMGLLVLFNAPWYLPRGSAEPFIFGFPYWAVITIILSLALCGYINWLMFSQWNIVEDVEEESDEERRSSL
ncbi:hypothetical protein CAY60_003890 [Shouchella clausii]|jgi:hypothetical protein|uniref:DUF3311 domain-containing protein n=1 Tax=Shouchella clausii TaxID=79880 RepID=A0A268NZH2_SHOCL|nr:MULTISPECIES: hypothetical protein [Shouchella]MCM3314518.1 hypothetical protein [Psychrobacillus sp. MER TA 17]ALA52319.1 hypothetical protein DB29_01491 [Shouchella clausii]AST95116.1 hypothetical protein BC8716_03610 [Shouchella clausii]KKI88369.1 hypothetical protein WZ76_00960 [Shouchella clausii]MBU3230246.1 hypothetical protein [Shouchella clausii]